MSLGISLIGIILSFAVLVLLMMRGVNLFVTVMCASLIAMLTGGIEIHTGLVSLYMDGFVGYYKSYFFMFLWGTLLGVFMECSGAATSIARWVIGLLKDKAYFAIPAATALLAYGGVAAIAATFPVIPIALAIFREYNYPRRLMPAFLFFGACTFAMVAPGAPQVQNIVPAEGFGLDRMAGAAGGFIGCACMAVIGAFWLRHMLFKAIRNGEHFEHRPTDSDTTTDKLPNPYLSLIPLIVTVVAINLKKGNANLLSVETSVFIGVACVIVIQAKYINFKESFLSQVGKGVSSAANVVFNISTIVGFGSIIKATLGFQAVVDWVVNLPLPYLVSTAIATTLICGICGSASGGLGIATPIFTSVYTAASGISFPAMARVMSLASSALDSAPHSGAVTSIINLCGETHKDAYIPIFKISVVTPAIATAITVVLFMLFPWLA